jgi:hypothetical protein
MLKFEHWQFRVTKRIHFHGCYAAHPTVQTPRTWLWITCMLHESVLFWPNLDTIIIPLRAKVENSGRIT